MKSSKQARRQAKELFRACLRNDRLDDDRVRQAVRQVIEAKPRGYMALLDQFRRLMRIAVARRTARVETAVPLDPAMAESIEHRLRELYDESLELTFAVDPTLIGGMRVRVGSDVLDGSVRGRLVGLGQSL
jgi:F-type H+-transporting ATPase subunit delta